MNIENNYELFDTHAHLTDKVYKDDFKNILERAKSNKVTKIICVGDSEEASKNAIQIARENNGVYASIGVHPHESKEYNPTTEQLFRTWVEDPKVLAIGEIGLDYYRMLSPKNIQLAVFNHQIELALESNKPVIIHCREAYNDLINILGTRKNLKGVVHCFSGNLDEANEIVKRGFYLGITGVITFPKSKKLYDVVKNISMEHILIETDCPYMSPEPLRGKRNEPANVYFIAEAISKITNFTLEDVARITTYNAKHLFNLISPEPSQIAYSIRNSLYLNITNRCSNRCVFCRKNTDYIVKGHYLKLEHEPDFEEIVEAIGNPSNYDEIVFCGYGEPTLRLELLKKIARYLKDKGKRIRLNTNGHGNLINKRDILPELQGLIDCVSISLNAQNAEIYNMLCKPDNPDEAYQSMITFAYLSRRYIPEVILTVVRVPEIDIEACRKIAENMGVKFRIREYLI